MPSGTVAPPTKSNRPCWNSSEDQPRLQPDVTKFHTRYSCYCWNLRGNVSWDKFWNGLGNTLQKCHNKILTKVPCNNLQTGITPIESLFQRIWGIGLPPGSLPTYPWPIPPPHPPSKPTCVHKQSLGNADRCAAPWMARLRHERIFDKGYINLQTARMDFGWLAEEDPTEKTSVTRASKEGAGSPLRPALLTKRGFLIIGRWEIQFSGCLPKSLGHSHSEQMRQALKDSTRAVYNNIQ